jgi:hypothetical protein
MTEKKFSSLPSYPKYAESVMLKAAALNAGIAEAKSEMGHKCQPRRSNQDRPWF